VIARQRVRGKKRRSAGEGREKMMMIEGGRGGEIGGGRSAVWE
jgi:hypothetical protein